MRTPSCLLRPVLAMAVLLAAAAAGAQTRRAITIDDLLALDRISDPQISPDGSQVAYTVATPDLAANRLARTIWIAPVAGDEAPRQLTESGHDSGARWAPDGRRLAFLSSRDGTAQVYLVDAAGGQPSRLTTLSGGADHIVWAPDGASLAFTSQVFADCADDACNAARLAERKRSRVEARVYDGLLYRHWTEWSTGRRSHLFVMALDGSKPRDLVPGASYDVPPVQRGGPHPIAFSPDGRELAFVAVTDAREAISTNGDIFIVQLDGATGPVRLTEGAGFDGAPAYSPDGHWLAYRSQATPGYESDRWRLMRYDRRARTHREVAPAFDRSVDAIAWSPDSATLYFTAPDRGYVPVFSVPTAGGTPKAITPDTYTSEFALSPDGRQLVLAHSSQHSPTELALVATGDAGAGARPLTRHNAERLSVLDLPEAEHFSFTGAGGASVHGMLLRPPAFDTSRKYPVVMILHGGPQTMFSDAWSWRWNTQMFASPGYAVLMINRRGSTGFGQQFTDEIRGDWGGAPYEDLMLGLDAALARYPFLDGDRVAAAGASYGGYMIAWMASKAQGRFKALVCHAGVYDLESMYGATEELWFPERDFGGPPWAARETYERLSPDEYAADFGKYRTPTLVTHGELDFRVPYTQGLEFYTALQRQGVPSRLVIFPDEGHWILKPRNSRLWYEQVLAWLGQYI